MGNCLAKSWKSGKSKGRGFFKSLPIAIPEVQESDNLHSDEIFSTSSVRTCNPVALGTCSEQGLVICHPTDDDVTLLKVPHIVEHTKFITQKYRKTLNKNASTSWDSKSIETQRYDGTSLLESSTNLLESGKEIVKVINKEIVHTNNVDTFTTNILPHFDQLLTQSESGIDSKHITGNDSDFFVHDQDELKSSSSESDHSDCDVSSDNMALGTETSIISHKENYDETDFGYVRQVILRKHQSPQNIQNFLNEFSQHRKFAVMSTDLAGGHYFLKDIDTFVYLQPNSVPHNSSKTILIARSANIDDFPPFIERTDIISDVFHFYPHRQRFKHRILVKIPLNAQEKEITILYSNTDHTTEANWKTVDCSSLDDDANSAPLYFSKNGYCYLFLKHFCLFCVVKSSFSNKVVTCAAKNQELMSIPLLVSMYGIYRLETEILTVTVAFQLKEDTPPIPKTYTTLGLLIEQDSFCFPAEEGSLKCTIHSPGIGWKLEGKKEPVKGNLLQIQNLQTCPIAKFQFKYYHDHLDQPQGYLKMEVDIYQRNEHVGTLSEAAISLTELIPDKPPTVITQVDTNNKQRVPVTTVDEKLTPLNNVIQPQKSLHNTCAIPKILPTTVPAFESQTYNINDSATRKKKLGDLSIEEVMPYFNEKYEKEHDSLGSIIKNKICQILDRNPNNWQKFGKKIGHGAITECLSQFAPGESPTRILLTLWQHDNCSHENQACRWPELVDKLESVTEEAGAALRDWITDNYEREDLVGESDHSSETPLLGHPPLLNSS